jgi:hypothetical protein
MLSEVLYQLYKHFQDMCEQKDCLDISVISTSK